MSKKAHAKRRKVDLSGFTAYSPSGVYPSTIPLSARAISSSSSPGPSLFNHVQINSEGAGKLSTSRTYMQAPPSPNKHGAPEPPLWNEEPLWNKEPLWNEEPDLAVDELLTPAQLDSTSEEYALDPDERERRHWRSDHPLLHWAREHRDLYLQEIIRLEGSCCLTRSTTADGGRGNAIVCRFCHKADALYRCKDCDDTSLLCAGCLRISHVHLPLHRIQHWNGTFFDRTSLMKLGQRIQLNHPPGQTCANPIPASQDGFTIIDTYGIHSVALDFCGCESAPSGGHTVQLLRRRLMPATVAMPRTAATFNVLEQFQFLWYQAKISLLQFYQSLARMTDNTGLDPPKDRYEAWIRMVKQWRHLKMLKRGGRGHDPTGVLGTREYELAVRCPACPRPGVNLPPNWELAPEDKKYLYALFLGLDANFRNVRKNVSSDEVDPGLNSGWAFVVEEKKYKTYLANHKGDSEVSTCNAHKAVNNADSHNSRGLAATGIGAVDCIRHDMKRAGGVGDLQKGERYCNMDYLFYNSTRDCGVMILIISYDIACQWHKHFYERMMQFPHEFKFDGEDMTIVFLVPKFHLPAHIEDCQVQFSFNYTPHVGRTDGEAPERGWDKISGASSALKEMGPGSRRDAIDDLLNDCNWEKIVGMGDTLLRKIEVAVPESQVQVAEHARYEQVLPVRHVEEWRVMVERWEADKNAPNPFTIIFKGPTEAGVKLEMYAAEAEAMARGELQMMHEQVTPCVFITSGLELEEQQRRLARDVKSLGLHSTDLQRGEITKRSNVLLAKIKSWFFIQQLYCPTASLARARALTARSDISPPESTQAIKLYLPSMLGTSLQCDEKLQLYEWQLRYAQAHGALEMIRSRLRLRSALYQHKDRFVRGQKANTRSRSRIEQVDAHIAASAEAYRVARAALLILSPILQKDPVWQDELRRLNDEDIRGLSVAMDGVSEGRRTISWIWVVQGVAREVDDDERLDESLRVEWCKSRSRAWRWSEEVKLLPEEMRRVLETLEWEAGEWESRGVAADSHATSPEHAEGLWAYARRQAVIRRRMAGKFAKQWDKVPALVAGDGLEVPNDGASVTLTQ